MFLKKITSKFNNQTSTVQAFIIFIIILIIGIALRWNYIVDNIIKGFDYFSQ